MITLSWYPYFDFAPKELFAGRDFFFSQPPDGLLVFCMTCSNHIFFISAGNNTIYALLDLQESYVYNTQLFLRRGRRIVRVRDRFPPQYLVDGGVHCATLTTAN
jgi:hypothetical protein